METLLQRRLTIATAALVAVGLACAPRTPPLTPDHERAFYEEGDDGVALPVLVDEVKPRYTPAAKAERITGSVWLSALVDRHGRVGAVEVTQSLDARLGLDDQAVAALRQWRFSPGTRFGAPVPVRVDVEMTYSLR